MDKIKIFINKYTNQIILGLLLVLFATNLFFTINTTLSDVDHKEFVYIFSGNNNYYNGDPGSWIMYKYAYLKNAHKLRIKYDLNSNNLLNEKSKDVLFVIDSSEASLFSTCGEFNNDVTFDSNRKNFGQFQLYQNNGEEKVCILEEVYKASDALLNYETELDNKVSIVTYNDDFNVLTGLTNDMNQVNNILHNIEPSGYTDYSKALEAIDLFLQQYTPSNNRELKIILYVGNVSKGNNTNESLLYQEIKRKYPNIVINALHNVVDNEVILEKIRNISDEQYLLYASSYDNGGIVNSSYNRLAAVSPFTYNNLFRQLLFNKKYDKFEIIDTINNEHFNFTDFKIIEKNNGDVDYNDNTLTWSLDRNMLTGEFVHLEVELSVNEDALLTDNLVPVSTSTQINSMLEGIPDENVNTNLTPYVSFYNRVIYNTDSLPETCNALPIEDEIHKIGENVDTNTKVPNCDGFTFVKWIVDSDYYNTPEYYFYEEDYPNGGVNTYGLNIKSQSFHPIYLGYYDEPSTVFADYNSITINNGILVMPGFDVYLKPVFKKLSISKDFTSDVSVELKTGKEVNKIFKQAVGTNCYRYDVCTEVISFKRAEELPRKTTYSITKDLSDFKVEVWFNYDDKTIYYYSDAPIIHMNENSSNLFKDFNSLRIVSGLSDFDTSFVEDMSSMFFNTKLNSVLPLSNWDTSNVRNMSSMFEGTPFVDLTPLANWNILNVTNMSHMFDECLNINSIAALSNWNTSNVTNMSYLFRGMDSVSDISPLASWDVSKVTDMSYMFAAIKQENDDYGTVNYRRMHFDSLEALRDWDVSNVENMSHMFYNSDTFSSLEPISDWNISKVKDMSYMFYNSNLIESLEPISDWNVSNVENMSYLFYSLTKIDSIEPLQNWDVSNVKDMSNMFCLTRLVESLEPIRNWNISKVTNMSGLFSSMTSITTLEPISDWNTSSVENFSGVFSGMSGITTIEPIRNWNIIKMSSIDYIFEFCTNLSDIDALESWDILNVTSLSHVFSGCESITDFSSISNWNTSNVTNLDYLFYNCKGITNLSFLQNWNVSKVTSMNSTFKHCDNLTSLNYLQNWDVTNLKKAGETFAYIPSLTDSSAINDWNIINCTSFYRMFFNTASHPNFTKVNGTWVAGSFNPITGGN